MIPANNWPLGVGGAGGAKGRTQGQSGRPKLAPRAEAGKRVTGGGPDTTCAAKRNPEEQS